MNVYIENIKRIKEELNFLDNRSYDTVEEAKNSILKYDSLLDGLMKLISRITEEHNLSVIEKEELFRKAVSILSSYIGNAEDGLKYQTIFNGLYKSERISEAQFNFFNENLNLERWR